MKKSRVISIVLIFLALNLISIISAGTCRDERGNYYYCEKYSRYNDCDWKAGYGYYNCGYYRDYSNYYPGYYYDYKVNYTKCSDYHYFTDIYDSDVYRHYCMNKGMYTTYLDNYGNLVKITRYDYTRRVYYDYPRYYDYQNDPLYPDYYRYQAEKENKPEKLQPPVIYIN